MAYIVLINRHKAYKQGAPGGGSDDTLPCSGNLPDFIRLNQGSATTTCTLVGNPPPSTTDSNQIGASGNVNGSHAADSELTLFNRGARARYNYYFWQENSIFKYDSRVDAEPPQTRFADWEVDATPTTTTDGGTLGLYPMFVPNASGINRPHLVTIALEGTDVISIRKDLIENTWSSGSIGALNNVGNGIPVTEIFHDNRIFFVLGQSSSVAIYDAEADDIFEFDWPETVAHPMDLNVFQGEVYCLNKTTADSGVALWNVHPAFGATKTLILDTDVAPASDNLEGRNLLFSSYAENPTLGKTPHMAAWQFTNRYVSGSGASLPGWDVWMLHPTGNGGFSVLTNKDDLAGPWGYLAPEQGPGNPRKVEQNIWTAWVDDLTVVESGVETVNIVFRENPDDGAVWRQFQYKNNPNEDELDQVGQFYESGQLYTGRYHYSYINDKFGGGQRDGSPWRPDITVVGITDISEQKSRIDYVVDGDSLHPQGHPVKIFLKYGGTGSGLSTPHKGIGTLAGYTDPSGTLVNDVLYTVIDSGVTYGIEWKPASDGFQRGDRINFTLFVTTTGVAPANNEHTVQSFVNYTNTLAAGNSETAKSPPSTNVFINPIKTTSSSSPTFSSGIYTASSGSGPSPSPSGSPSGLPSGALSFPSWGRCFWQEHTNGEIILLYASGNTEVDFISSSDSGVNWTNPTLAFYVDTFAIHNNFDSEMDRAGNVHCVHRYSDSGCYTLLAKDFINGGWAQSGVVGRGFVDVGDTDEAKGVQGSVFVTDEALGLFGDISGPYPQVRLVVKDSSNDIDHWYIKNPFTDFPIRESISGVSSPNAGPLGGFPISTNAGAFGGQKILYCSNATGIIQVQKSTGSWEYNQGRNISLDPGFVASSDTPEESGFVGELPFGPNMTWIDTKVGDIWSFLVTQDRFAIPNEMYTTAAEPFAIGRDADFFGRVRSLADYTTGSNFRFGGDYFLESLLTNVYGATPFMSGGTPVDMSYGNENKVLYIYWQHPDNVGRQTVFRTKVGIENQTGGSTGSKTKYTFNGIETPESGFVSWADSSVANAGTSGLKQHWQKFKALRHPTAPGSGVEKLEIVATIGHGISDHQVLDSGSQIYTWRFRDSLAATNRPQLPTFAMEHTADSGNSFVGIKRTSGFNGAALFDGDNSTGISISSGDFIVLEFSRALPFSRLEVGWDETSSDRGYHGIEIDSSVDDVSYERAETIDVTDAGVGTLGNHMAKFSSEWDVVNEPDIFSRIHTFTGKYLKLTFVDRTVAKDTRFLRLYGGESSAGRIVTTDFNRDFIREIEGRYIHDGGNVETFRFGNSLPVGWTSYGDWTWDREGGYVQSGVYSGRTIGSGDLWAARTARSTPPNTSGVLETEINVGANEFTSEGGAGRNVKFDVSYDLLGIGNLSAIDPNDDQLRFIIETSGTPVEISGYWQQANNYISPAQYYTVEAIAPRGTSKLQWVYERGNLAIASGGPEAVAWIDNVHGLDQSTYGLVSIYGYMSGAPSGFDSFTAYAYMSGANGVDQKVYSYSFGTGIYPSGNVNAYLNAVPTVTGVVNAYMNSSAIETIYGYTQGELGSASNSIYGFTSASGDDHNVYGWLQNRFNESINAYLKAPSGTSMSVNAYVTTPEFLIINGYLKAPDSGSIRVNAYLKANGVQESVYGYMFASGLPSGFINAYTKADGAAQVINAYLPRGINNQIAGYIKGAAPATGSINAWTSGLGFVSDKLNAYVLGVSGIPSGSFNGFVEGVEVQDKSIYGWILGYDDDDACDFPVPNKSFVSAPSGAFFG